MSSWWVCPCDGWTKMLRPDQACPVGTKRSKRKGCGAPPPMACACGSLISKPDSLFPKCQPCKDQP